jgi:hypothetical protein
MVDGGSMMSCVPGSSFKDGVAWSFFEVSLSDEGFAIVSE